MAAPLPHQQQLMSLTRANVQDLQSAARCQGQDLRQLDPRTQPSAARYQGQDLWQLDPRTQPTHGTSAPGYFMNFHQYYPGFGQ